MAFEKGDGLGVLESYKTIVFALGGIQKKLRKALKGGDRDRSIKDALNIAKDLKLRLDKSIDDGKKLKKETSEIIKRLEKNVLPLIFVAKKK